MNIDESQASPLLTLPNELLFQIFQAVIDERLSDGCQYDYRLLCKRVDAIGLDILCTKIEQRKSPLRLHYYATETSLAIIEAVSSNPRLAALATDIECPGFSWNEAPFKRDNKQQTQYLEYEKRLLDPVNKANFDMYTAFCRRQYLFRHTKRTLGRLRASLERMSQLRTLTYTRYIVRFEGLSFPWLHEKGLDKPESDDDDVWRAPKVHQRFRALSPWASLVQIAQALTWSNCPVNKLILKNVVADLSMVGKHEREFLEDFMSFKIKRLEIVEEATTYDRLHESFVRGLAPEYVAWTQFLGGASHRLRTLTLSLTPRLPGRNCNEFEDMICSVYWPGLRSISFSNTGFDHGGLVYFLDRHRASLSSVTLVRCESFVEHWRHSDPARAIHVRSSGKWTEIISLLRSMVKERRLRRIHIELTREATSLMTQAELAMYATDRFSAETLMESGSVDHIHLGSSQYVG